MNCTNCPWLGPIQCPAYVVLILIGCWMVRLEERKMYGRIDLGASVEEIKKSIGNPGGFLSKERQVALLVGAGTYSTQIPRGDRFDGNSLVPVSSIVDWNLGTG